MAGYIPAVNYYGMIGDIGDTIANGLKEANKQRLLSALGSDISSGNYDSAAQRALQGGDIGIGMKLMELGRQAKTDAAIAPMLSALGGGQGAAVASAPATGDTSVPRGLRNNNPGNIEDGPFAKSMPGYAGSDGRFARFASLDNGVNAQSALLGKYGQQGINTVAGVVGKWAPSAENGEATGNYAKFVAKKLGVDPNAPIDMSDPVTRQRMAYAMGEFENGRPVAGARSAPVQVAQAAGGAASDASPLDKIPLPAIQAMIQSPQYKPLGEALLKRFIANQDQEKWSTVDPGEYGKYNIPKDTPGPVLINKNGDIKAPLKPSNQVTLNQNTEKTYDAEIAKQYSKKFGDYQDSGNSAVNELNTLRYMKRIVDDPAFYSGTGGAAATQAKRALVALGVADAKDAAPNELFEKLSNKAVLDGLGGSLGTGISNADRDFIQRTTANIGNTKEGNRQIIDVGIKLAERKQQIAQKARDYARSHNGRLDMGFDEELAAWSDKNPLFKGMQSPAEPTGGGDAQPAKAAAQAGGANLPVVSSPEEARKLPRGTAFRTPDGRSLVVP